ncbi:hypothetical protein Ahy_A03g015893 [Arachis hypogaea]|uniref:Uncharacterized protein n=1 Tax=Arachis hypogaea TaxID=3818 RepID=A0A445E1Q5_ARAHY|nr:hypothetical protein Ahy_A03g015893 [Arachis hypogaea]
MGCLLPVSRTGQERKKDYGDGAREISVSKYYKPKTGLHGMRWTEMLFYKILISVVRDGIKYDSFVIDSNDDLQVLFHCYHQFFEVRTHELIAKFGDVVSNSGGLNRNHQSVIMAATSNSTPVVASSSVSVIAHAAVLVTSPSFAADLIKPR